MSAPATLRDARRDDLGAIVRLLNALLATTTYEYTEIPHTVESRSSWFERQLERGFPVLVADVGGDVVGFASYGDFRDSIARTGFRHTVEHTVHVDERWWATGIATLLMEALVERALGAGVHVMIGAIDASNVGSLLFHERLGFVEVGRLPEVGRKFGQWCDLVLMQRMIGTVSEAPTG
jgi:L-amino acid N-acyltransferase YncA